MRKLLAAAAFLGAVTAVPASAQFSANIGVVSDYRFRAISQTNGNPALQGGLDYAFSNGLYVGTWMSTVTKDLYPHGSALEWDFYGGWKKEFAKDWTVDLGVLHYYYPGARFYTFGVGGTANNAKSNNKFDNTELYAGVSYKWLSAKLFVATSNYFGASGQAYGNAALGGVNSNNTATGSTTGSATAGSKGTTYLDLAANYEFAPKWTLNAHAGVLRVKSFSGLNYVDYKLGVTYDAGWASLSAAVIGSNAQAQFYRVPTSAAVLAGNGSTYDPTKPTIVLGLSKTF